MVQNKFQTNRCLSTESNLLTVFGILSNSMPSFNGNLGKCSMTFELISVICYTYKRTGCHVKMSESLLTKQTKFLSNNCY